MDPAALPKPNRYWIASETTRLEVVPWPPGGQSNELILNLAVTEQHRWRGIGAAAGGPELRDPRTFTSKKPPSLALSISGPDCLRDGERCRNLIRGMIRRELGERYGGTFQVGDWDESVVPRGVEARVAERVGAAAREEGCTYEVFVDVGVRVGFLYCEAHALLCGCARAAAGDDETSGRAAAVVVDDDGGGTAPPCSICFEEMARDVEAIRLPGCGHGFHHECIGKWFHKASTCPVCRRDKIQYLPPGYRALREKMCSTHVKGQSSSTQQLPS